MKSKLTQQFHMKLDALPSGPGVYLLRNADGHVIYVGKAKVLRSRVRSYFVENANDGRPQYAVLVRNIADVDYIATATEQEALLLESVQIKLYKPRYNIHLKDDKKYPYIRITAEPFPRIFATRDIEQDGSRYLGPFSNVRAMKTTLDTLQKIFPVRSCTHYLPSAQVKVCLDYQIKRCEGPCEGLVTENEYRNTINSAVRFLRGRNAGVVSDLRLRMQQASSQLRFEVAAKCRDQIQALETMQARQKIMLAEEIDRDIVGLARHDDEACCSVLEIREGRLSGRKHHFLSDVLRSTDGAIVSAFVRQFYMHTDFVPAEIHLPVDLLDNQAITAWLTAKVESRVSLSCPLRGDKAHTLEIANTNATHLLKERQLKRELQKERLPQAVNALRRDLDLPKPPRHIEGIDISNFQGTDSVGSVVCFVDGKPKRSQYRQFKIKEISGPNDFASIQQVVERHFGGLLDRGETMPDLLMIDGGKGQMSSAVTALNNIGLHSQAVIGLAKRLEEIFVPGQSETVILPRTSASLRLLQTLRDEAHRFALRHHRNLREKRTLGSRLDNIPGIGPNRRKALLRAFGSIQRIREAQLEEIAAVKGLGWQIAIAIKDYLSDNRS